jgi:aldehyde dehydrogenase
MDADDDYFDKALEGFAMFGLNQGEVCTCPSRAGAGSIYEVHGTRRGPRAEDPPGQPARSLDHDRRAGFNEQLEKILSYIDIGKNEGAKVLTGGSRHALRRSGQRLLRDRP